MNRIKECPNTNLQEWKDLVASKGLEAAYTQWIYGETLRESAFTKQAKEDLSKILPKSIGVEVINKIASDPSAAGVLLDNVISLRADAPAGTQFHEAFHAVYRLLLTDNEIDEYDNIAYKEILANAKKNGTSVAQMIRDKQAEGYYPGLSPQQALPKFVEEYIADRFQGFMKAPKDTSFLGQLFTRIMDFLRSIKLARPDLAMYFRRIEQGKYVNSTFMKNRFDQEDFIGEPVYKLLNKAPRFDSNGEDVMPKFGSDETQELIRDTAAYYFEFKNSKLARKEQWTDDAIIDKILDVQKKRYSPWSSYDHIGTPEHDYYHLYSSEDEEYTDDEGYTEVILGERTEFKLALLKYLKNFRKMEALSRDDEDTMKDDIGDKAYLNAEMKPDGGWGTLPEFVRQYIAQITYQNGDVIIGHRDEIDEEGFPQSLPIYQKKAVNPTKVYNGLLRALANEGDENNMMEKLIRYGELVEVIDSKGKRSTDMGNLDTYHFVKRFLADTKLDVDSLMNRADLDPDVVAKGFVPENNVNANIIYQKIVKGFNRWAKDTVFTEFNTGTKEARSYLANRKNVAQKQFEQWQNSFDNRDTDRIAVAKEIDNMIDSFREQSAYFTDELGDDYLRQRTRAQVIAEQIGRVNDVMLKLGIQLSPAYIKYSILSPKLFKLEQAYKDSEIEFSEDTITKEEYRFLKNTDIPFEERLSYENLTVLSTILKANRSPFTKSDNELEIDDAAIGRILKIGKGNAKLDESVFESSYTAADGTVRYLHQDGTYHLKAVGKLRDPKFVQQLKDTGIRDVNIITGMRRVTDPETGVVTEVPVNIDEIDADFVKNTILLNPEISDFLKMHQSLRVEELDGVQSLETKYDDEGKVTGTERTDGRHFGDMTAREFAITLMSMYGNSKNYVMTSDGKQITVVPQLISVMETSKSADFVYLPVIKGLYQDGNATDKTIDLIEGEFAKEFDRIYKTFNDITNDNGEWLSEEKIQEKLGFVADGYHNAGDKSRGLQLSDKISSVVSEGMRKAIEKDARNMNYAAWVAKEHNRTELRQELADGTKALVEEYLDLLTTEEIISTNNQGKIHNNFLSDVYFKGDDKLGFSTVLEDNIGQAFMQHWLNSMSFAQLIHGDFALMYKNDMGGTDYIKRGKPDNAKIVSIKHNRTIEKLGVTPFEYSRVAILDEPVDMSKITGKKIDQADAQVWSSVQAIRNSLFGMGRLTPEIAALLDKMERGEKILPKDLFNISGDVLEQDRFINSFKFVFKDSKRTVKMSVVPLTKELTSDYVNGAWVPKFGREELHKMREAMDHPTNGIDFIGPKSAFKTYRSNVHRATNKDKTQFDYRNVKTEKYDNDFFGLQLEVPSNKVKITTPTQLLHAIDNEQDDDTMTYLNGNDEPISIKEIRTNYQKSLATKSRIMFESAKAEMYQIDDLNKDLNLMVQQGKITPRLARFQEKAIENLQASGADTQLLEFFELRNDTPLYDLNNDLVIEKYTQLYLSHFSKGAFSLKNPGYSVSLLSNFGITLLKRVRNIQEDGQIEWEVVPTGSPEYMSLHEAGIRPRNAQWAKEGNKTVYKDATLEIGDYFVDKPAYNVPEWKENKIVGYYSEAVMPYQTADQAKLIGTNVIPDQIAYLFGNRIPLQDKHSMLAMKWVDTLPLQYGSTGVFPSEIVELSGADFDIDKLFISAFDTYVKDGQFHRYGDKTEKQEQFEEYLKWQLKNNKFLKSMMQDYKNKDEDYIKLMDSLQSYREKLGKLLKSRDYKDLLEAKELNSLLERVLNIHYDEDGNAVRLYDAGTSVPDNIATGQVQSKLRTLNRLMGALDVHSERIDYHREMMRQLHDTMNHMEYEFLHRAMVEYAPNMPTSVDRYTDDYNVGSANNNILKSFMALLTNDAVRDGVSDQPATQDYLESGGNTESNDMNPAFIREDGSYVFSGGKKYPANSMIAHIQAKRKGGIGKNNISIDVSGNVQNTILKKGKIDLIPTNKIKFFTIFSSFNGEPVEFKSFSPMRELDLKTLEWTGKRIMDVISTKISASTDEAKEGNNARFNLGSEQSKVISVMSALGIPLEIGIALVNQPAIIAGEKVPFRSAFKTADESKFVDEEEAFQNRLVEFDKRNKALDVAARKLIDEHGSLDRYFNFDQMAQILREDWAIKYETLSDENKVIFNHVQKLASIEYDSLIELADKRAMIGDILKLNKGVDSFETASKALESASRLGIVDGMIDEDIPFDVRYIFTGNKDYPANSDYVHRTSISYLNQIDQLDKLSKLNFVSKTSYANRVKDKIIGALRLTKDEDRKQLDKDFLSYVSIAAYKELSQAMDKTSPTFRSSLITSEKDNIIAIYKDLKAKAPKNKLLNYIVPKQTKTVMYNKLEFFNTLEANSFAKLDDIQLGHIINGYLELENNPETKAGADALLDYLFIKDAFQFKNKSISKVFPVEKFTRLSTVTSIAHKVLLAETDAGMVTAGEFLNNELGREIIDIKQLKVLEYDDKMSYLYRTVFGKTPDGMFNSFHEIVARQPIYSKKTPSVQLGVVSNAVKLVGNSIIIDAALGDRAANKVSLGLMGFNIPFTKDLKKMRVNYPKFIRNRYSHYILTGLDGTYQQDGVRLGLSDSLAPRGLRAVYQRIDINTNTQWNQMADLNPKVIFPLEINQAIGTPEITTSPEGRELKKLELIPSEDLPNSLPQLIAYREKLFQDLEAAEKRRDYKVQDRINWLIGDVDLKIMNIESGNINTEELPVATVRVISDEKKGINISTRSDDPLGRALTNPVYGSRKDGKKYFDVETAYKAGQSLKTQPDLNAEEALKYDMNLMYKLQLQKFAKNPELVDEITKRGGTEFLKASEHTVGIQNSRWEGKGEESNFMKVLIKAYEKAANVKPSEPVYKRPNHVVRQAGEVTPEKVASLKENEVFVFGSNGTGDHGAGAALDAKNLFGAENKNPEGPQGKSYAIITKKNWKVEKSSTLQEIEEGIVKFLRYAQQNTETKFLVTKIGSDKAGYTVPEIKNLFEKNKALIPQNVILPAVYEFRDTKLPDPILDNIVEDEDFSFNDISYDNDFENDGNSGFEADGGVYSWGGTKRTEETVQSKVTTFMEGLNVDIQHFETLKEVTGYHAISAVDLMQKVALFSDKADDRAYAKEAAYVAYSFLGKKNKIVTDLKFNIEQIDNYKEIYNGYKKKNPKLGDMKIKELIVIDFIADSIQENFNTPKESYINRETEFWSIKGNSALEKRLKYHIMKIKQFLKELLGVGKLSHQNLKELADDIANDVLTQNYSKFQKDLKPDQALTNYNETIANDPVAEGIVKDFQDMGILLTGSLAIRKQGSLYRSAAETLHDLDFIVPRALVRDDFIKEMNNLESVMEGASDLGKGVILDKFVRDLNKNLQKWKWFADVKAKYPDFKVTTSFSGLKKGDITISGLINDQYVIDFFISTQDETNKEGDKGFASWQNIFAAKLKMGRAKDMLDFKHFKPFNGLPKQLAGTTGFRHFTFDNPLKNYDNTKDNSQRCD